MGCPGRAVRVSAFDICWTLVLEGALRSGLILFPILLFLTFTEAQKITIKVPHPPFSFLYVPLCLYTSISLHSSIGCLHPKCHIWCSPICSECPVLGVSLPPNSCQPCSPFLGPWAGCKLPALWGVI